MEEMTPTGVVFFVNLYMLCIDKRHKVIYIIIKFMS